VLNGTKFNLRMPLSWNHHRHDHVCLYYDRHPLAVAADYHDDDYHDDGDVAGRMSMDPAASPKDSCQLSTRSWTITDEEGREEKVEGPGVVGQLSLSLTTKYTVYQKTMQLTFDHNFGKCRPIFKILSLGDPRETIYVTVLGSSITS